MDSEKEGDAVARKVVQQLQHDGAEALKAKICVNNWAGRRGLDCEVVKETKTRYVCRMLSDGLLPRGHVQAGDIVKEPKNAVIVETERNSERGIPNFAAEVEVNKADPANLEASKRQGLVYDERTLEGLQGRGESLVSQLDSAANQAEQLSDQLGVYVQEKAQQIDRLQSSLAAVLASPSSRNRQAGRPAKKRTFNGSSRLRDERPGSRRSRCAWIGWGRLKMAGVYAETKIEELAERKLRFDKPELAQQWDKIQRRERQALIPKNY